MFVGLQYTSHGNYKCLFCNHKVWKTATPAETHVTKKHPAERAELLSKKLQEAQNKPPRIEYKERVVYKDRPEPEYKDKLVNVFCETCFIVMQDVRLPKNNTIHNTSCNYCGCATLKLVHKIA